MISWQSVILLVFSYVIVPRLTFLPSQIHTLLILFGPFLFPRILQLFSPSRATGKRIPVRPTPPNVQHALNLLFVSVVAWLVLSLPQFSPENVFMKTQSRLQIDPNTLFARLGARRELNREDEELRAKFATSGMNKLLYLAFGPDTLLNCVWCATSNADDKMNYFLYSLPNLLKSHIIHLGVLGLATSSIVGPEGSRFRTHVTIAGLVLIVAEAWYLGSYDIQANRRAKTLQEIDFCHWKLRTYRYIGFAATDAVLGTVLWLTSTNRWLAKPPAMAERLESTTRLAEESMNKLRAVGLINNSVYRDQMLRRVREDYWQTEGQVMSETVQDEEVMGKINEVLTRLDMKSLEGQIGQVADVIVSSIDQPNRVLATD